MEQEKEKSPSPSITADELSEMLEMVRYLVDAYGSFAQVLGNIQRDHKESYENMMSPSSLMQIPDMLNKLAEKKPELNNILTKLFIKMSTFLPQLSNLMSLTAEEKIKLGINLKSTAKDIDELLDLTKVKVE